MGVQDNGSLSFGKKLGSVNYEKFNGVSAEDFKNSKLSNVQKQLAEAILGKYNKNGDAILDKGELVALQKDLDKYAKDGELGIREADKFLKDLNLTGLKREDIHAVMQYIASDTDSIDNAETKDGVTVVKYKPTEGGVVVEDRLIDFGDKQVRQSQTRTNINEPEGTYVTDHFASDGQTKTKSEFYQDGKLSMLEEFSGNTTTTTLYENEEVSSKTRKIGEVVTEELDNNDRVTKRTTNKGSGIIETIEFTYNDDGTTTETTTTTGSDPITVKKDKDGNIITEAPAQEETAQDYVHTVQAGDTWYGIVQAKYGINDHKQIMEIVHQLKDTAGIKYNEVKIPKEITLPAKVTLKNGTEIPLGDTNAAVDVNHNRPVVSREVVTVADDDVDNVDNVVQVDPNPPVIKPFKKPFLRPAPMRDLMLPQKEDNIDWLNFTARDKANKTIKNADGTSTKYDEEGRVAEVRDQNGNLICEVSERDENGKVCSYNMYMRNGNTEYQICRDGSGNCAYYYEREYDMNGKLVRIVFRNAEGSVKKFEDFECDVVTGKEITRIYRNADGSVDDYWETEYDSEGKCTREIKRDANGNFVAYYNSDDLRARNADGTLQK